MLHEGFWALVALLDPTRPAQLVLGLAVVAAALLVAVAAGLPVLIPAAVPAVRAVARRSRPAVRPRLTDPDAAGHPRSRAPAPRPAVA
jgi:hypothetical protein